ncbi:unnamed protein product, partial [Polarella glacialis]
AKSVGLADFLSSGRRASGAPSEASPIGPRSGCNLQADHRTHSSVDFELRMPGGLGAELHVDGVMVEAEFDGVVGGGSVQLPSSVEPQGWYWRPSGLADNSVHVNLSPSVDVPPASPKRHNRSSTASFGALGSKEHFAGTLATLCLGPSCRHATLPVAGSLLTEDGHANWS